MKRYTVFVTLNQNQHPLLHNILVENGFYAVTSRKGFHSQSIIYSYIKFDPDQRNFIVASCLAYAKHDTGPAKLARYIYGRKHNVQQIANDWWSEKRNEAPLGEVLRPVIENVLGQNVGA